jgi:hypothetical protein
VTGERRTARPPRRPAALAAAAASVVLVVAAVVLTPWCLLALPFTVVSAYAFWLGLSGDELLEVLDTQREDPGTGPIGMLP